VAPPVFKTGLSLLVGDGRFDSFPSPPKPRILPVGMRALDGDRRAAYTHRSQTHEIEFGPSSPHVSNGHRAARTQAQLRSDSQPEGTGSHA